MVQEYRQIQSEKAYIREKEDCPPHPPQDPWLISYMDLASWLSTWAETWVLSEPEVREPTVFLSSSFDVQSLEIVGQTQVYSEKSCFENDWGAMRSKATGFGSNFFL